MVTCRSMFSSRYPSRGLRRRSCLHVQRADQVAAAHLQPRVAAHRASRTSRGRPSVRHPPPYPRSRNRPRAARLHGHSARDRHFQVVGDPLVVGRAILAGAHQQAVACAHDSTGVLSLVPSASPRAYARISLWPVTVTFLRVAAGDLEVAEWIVETMRFMPAAGRAPKRDSRTAPRASPGRRRSTACRAGAPPRFRTRRSRSAQPAPPRRR